MKEISEEAKTRFFEEIGICLKRGGFQTGPMEERHMPVSWQEAPLCRVNGLGGIRYHEEDVRNPDAKDALLLVLNIVNTTVEYMRMLEKAPQLWTRAICTSMSSSS